MINTNKQNAFLIAGSQSGSGKTTITLALMAAFVRLGLKVQPFKCGPDFIDPTLHEMVTTTVSRNLDLQMCGQPFVENCFNCYSAGADISVIEGVMGLFDGAEGSSSALAKALGLPVILVVDVKGAAESAAALVKGFETLDPDLTIHGIILNRVGSIRHLQLLTKAITKHCRAEILGYLPRDIDFSIPERHLGLFMGDESPLKAEQIAKMAETVEEHIDIKRLQTLAGCQPQSGHSLYLDQNQSLAPKNQGRKVRIGVAMDQAFCFYYQDNLDLLRQAGAELIFFSPLIDNNLPQGLCGLYLGGGYPELHARQLSENHKMRQTIHNWSNDGRPIFAECGGFMYLCDEIVDSNDHYYPMAAVFPTRAKMKQRLARLGYRQATINGSSIFGNNGYLLGHEFHYSDIEELPASIPRIFRLEDGRDEGYQLKNTLGGYIHFHFGATPEAADHFVRFCQNYK